MARAQINRIETADSAAIVAARWHNLVILNSEPKEEQKLTPENGEVSLDGIHPEEARILLSADAFTDVDDMHSGYPIKTALQNVANGEPLTELGKEALRDPNSALFGVAARTIMRGTGAQIYARISKVLGANKIPLMDSITKMSQRIDARVAKETFDD